MRGDRGHRLCDRKTQDFRVAMGAKSRMAQLFKDFREIYSNSSTGVDLLRYRCLHQPDQLAFTFLEDGEAESDRLTYSELDRRSRAIAAQLQALGASGERALLLYPPGLDYIAAFFGCLYAGAIAVPAYPPRNQRHAARLQTAVSVATDSQAAIALTTTAILPQVQSLLADKIESIHWLTTDTIPAGIEDSWQKPSINSETLAFLQYTSGSTGTPKGAMLSHRNLLHNAHMTQRLMGHSHTSKFVSWLPIYHDMGLIGGVLQPLYGGFPCIMMPPASFLQSPYRWLKAISHYQATTSGGPNFAYELCVQKISQQQRETLDLSSWKVAFNGAEPIRRDTLERFAAAFAPCGFRWEAFYPCYGMAEAALMISGGLHTAPPVIKTVQGEALETDRAIATSVQSENVRTLVGCGQTLPDQKIAIANPETLTRCQPDEVGEIWVSGPSVGVGYWNRTEETERTFRAYLSDTGEGPFLRTGDLGFLQDGELFITGRAKDLIIIRGRNLYPQDIELTAEGSHPALRSGGSAAFSVDVEDEEQLVVVQEVEFRQKPNVEEVTTAIRSAIAQIHGIQVYAVVTIAAGSIPKTSSGKIQRRACRADFLSGNLKVIGSSILEDFQTVDNEGLLTREQAIATPPTDRVPLLISYLQQQIAQVLRVPRSQVNPQQSAIALGLDSLKVFELQNRIETDLATTVSAAELFESSSLSHLAAQLCDRLATVTSSVPPLLPAPTQAELPLSFAQQRLWFLDSLQPGNPFYNIAVAVKLKGPLNVTALNQSFNEILQRQAALRTTFTAVSGQPRQAIAPTLTLALPVIDLRSFPETSREAEAQRLATQEAQQPFDLTAGPLLRVTLLQLAEAEYTMLLTVHHIVADGWSMGVFIQELTALYRAFSSGQPSPLTPLPIQYADFGIWQRQWLQGEVLESQLAYWKQELSNLPVLQLPTDNAIPAIQTFQGLRLPFSLSKALTDALKVRSQQQEVSLFMTLLASFTTLLHWYSAQDEITVGTDIANRNQSETRQLIGFFVNQLVLRTNLSGNPTFDELLHRVRDRTLAAYAHQDLPFDKLVEVLNPERTLSRTPLFQVKLVLQAPLPPLALSGVSATVCEVDSQTAKYDLLLNLTDSETGLTGWMEYSTDLFATASIARMLSLFETLLNAIAVQSEVKLSVLKEILNTADEQWQLAKEQELKEARLLKFKNVKRKAIEQLV